MKFNIKTWLLCTLNILHSDFLPYHSHLHIQFVPEFMEATQRYMRSLLSEIKCKVQRNLEISGLKAKTKKNWEALHE